MLYKKYPSGGENFPRFSLANAYPSGGENFPRFSLANAIFTKQISFFKWKNRQYFSSAFGAGNLLRPSNPNMVLGESLKRRLMVLGQAPLAPHVHPWVGHPSRGEQRRIWRGTLDIGGCPQIFTAYNWNCPLCFGDWGHDFGREAPKFGAEGAVLESFSEFSEKLCLKNAVESTNCGIMGLEKFLFFFSKKLLLKTAIRCMKLGYVGGFLWRRRCRKYFWPLRTRYFVVFSWFLAIQYFWVGRGVVRPIFRNFGACPPIVTS